ncbi:DUF6088 family protein [Pseudomonas aeruginosa]|uniref:DUF6088 family protein n=1 Tax=Pseudomonas aeruginosa TaxID=287 RepID=UPI001F30CAF7|nr:DUF6088 family protein [Pseudomonas aeruginosa]
MSRPHSEPPVSHLVTQRVKFLRKGRPFSIRCLAELGSSSAISKAVAQLVRRGELERVYRGIYMRPKYSKRMGITPCRRAPSCAAAARPERWPSASAGA